MNTQKHAPSNISSTARGGLSDVTVFCRCGAEYVAQNRADAEQLLNQHVEKENPTWSSTLPMVSGYYWMRYPNGDKAPVEIHINEHLWPWVMYSPRKDEPHTLAMIKKDWQFWPIPITPPEDA